MEETEEGQEQEQEQEEENNFRPKFVKTEVYNSSTHKWERKDFRSVKKNDIFRTYKFGPLVVFCTDEYGNWAFRAVKDATTQNGFMWSIPSKPLAKNDPIVVNNDSR